MPKDLGQSAERRDRSRPARPDPGADRRAPLSRGGGRQRAARAPRVPRSARRPRTGAGSTGPRTGPRAGRGPAGERRSAPTSAERYSARERRRPGSRPSPPAPGSPRTPAPAARPGRSRRARTPAAPRATTSTAAPNQTRRPAGPASTVVSPHASRAATDQLTPPTRAARDATLLGFMRQCAPSTPSSVNEVPVPPLWAALARWENRRHAIEQGRRRHRSQQRDR